MEKQTFIDDFEDNFDFYNQSSIEQDLEDDMISANEEGFMMGYLS